jgi:hypothetical protein
MLHIALELSQCVNYESTGLAATRCCMFQLQRNKPNFGDVTRAAEIPLGKKEHQLKPTDVKRCQLEQTGCSVSLLNFRIFCVGLFHVGRAQQHS